MSAMLVDEKAILASFYGGLSMNLKLLRDVCHVQSLEVIPDRSSPFYSENAEGHPLSLFLPIDAAVGMTALRFDKWDPRKQEFLGLILRDFSEELTLIDIGSNVGLFARQCLNRFPNICKAYCYEPNPLNFKLLSRNLQGLVDVDLYNFGLSKEGGSMEFYVDLNNAGNQSLNRNAMQDEFSSIKVEIRDARSECKKWMEKGYRNFIYKSDTQGFDEIISTALDFDFWRHVKVGILELWRLPGKACDHEKLSAIFDLFPNKVLENNAGVNMSSAEIIDYLSHTDMAYDDLIFWQS